MSGTQIGETTVPRPNLQKISWGRWTSHFRFRSGLSAGEFLPSFFIIGPPRTGTTWLHEVLRTRTVLPTVVKETRFFDTHFHRGLRWYQAHFLRSEATAVVGEVAPTYFSCPEARQRIAALVPHAKVICIFRDPVERVLSLYRVKRAYGMIPWNFEQALLHDPELTESSRYATHFKAWLGEFSPGQVLATFYDDLRDAPQAFVNRLADFIGIPHFSLTGLETASIHGSDSLTHPRCYLRTRSATILADWLKARHFGGFVAAVKNSAITKLFLGGGPPFAGLSREVSMMLQELFRREVEELEIMLQRDLSAWKPLHGELSPIEVRRADDEFRLAA